MTRGCRHEFHRTSRYWDSCRKCGDWRSRNDGPDAPWLHIIAVALLSTLVLAIVSMLGGCCPASTTDPEQQCRDVLKVWCDYETLCDGTQAKLCTAVIEEKCPINQTVLSPLAETECLNQINASAACANNSLHLSYSARSCITTLTSWRDSDQ